MSTTEPDELYLLRSKFYLGNYEAAIEEADQVVSDTPQMELLRDWFVARSQMALGRPMDINTSVPSGKALRLLQEVSNASPSSKEHMLTKLDDLMASTPPEDVLFNATAALAFLQGKQLKAALKLVHGGESLEEMAIAVLIFLQLDREDLARKKLALMQGTDDDDVLPQLTSVWIALYSHKDLQEAADTIQELVAKFGGQTVSTLELLAAIDLARDEYASAMKYLAEARNASISTNQKVSSKTFLNSFICVHFLQGRTGGPPLGFSERILSEFQVTHPSHCFFEKRKELEETFDKCASRFDK